LRFSVPSLAELTPGPALTFVVPFGRRTSGQIFRHWAVQATLLGLSVYTVLPVTRIVPNLAFFAVATTLLA